MANTLKVLGQAAPSASSPTDVYTVPADTQALVSTIVVCNRSASAGTFRLAVRPGGATIDNSHYIAYDVPISGSDATTLTLGIGLGAGDVITVDSTDLSTISYNIFGTEIV